MENCIKVGSIIIPLSLFPFGCTIYFDTFPIHYKKPRRVRGVFAIVEKVDRTKDPKEKFD